MKTIFLAAALLCTSLAQAADPDDSRGAPAPNSPSPAINRCADRATNFTTNGWAFKDPRNFLQGLDVFSDPGFWLELARRAMDPQSTVRSLSTLLDPGTPKNYLEWTDPEIYGKWARAAAEPDYYRAVDALLLDPGRAMRWAMLPTDARAWNLLATAISPDTWMKWLTAPFHPKTRELVEKALNPETSQNWLRALADPGNYPALKASPLLVYGGRPGNPYPAVSGIPEMKSL